MMHERARSYAGYDSDSLVTRLDEVRYRASQHALDYDLGQLEPVMIKEMQDEVYQQVMKDLEKGFKVDTSQLSKSIADGINSAIKTIGK